MNGRAPAEMTAPWGQAFAAVSRDLQCGRHGRVVSLEAVAWELTVHADGAIYIGLTPGPMTPMFTTSPWVAAPGALVPFR
jgi:hypothetical protein